MPWTYFFNIKKKEGFHVFIFYWKLQSYAALMLHKIFRKKKKEEEHQKSICNGFRQPESDLLYLSPLISANIDIGRKSSSEKCVHTDKKLVKWRQTKWAASAIDDDLSQIRRV